MDDDLNTPQALATLQELRSEINDNFCEGCLQVKNEAREEFRSLGKTLGLFQLEQSNGNSTFRLQELVNWR